MFESDCVRIREVVIDKAKQRKAGWWFCRVEAEGGAMFMHAVV
jgi:hypothetical protein